MLIFCIVIDFHGLSMKFENSEGAVHIFERSKLTLSSIKISHVRNHCIFSLCLFTRMVDVTARRKLIKSQYKLRDNRPRDRQILGGNHCIAGSKVTMVHGDNNMPERDVIILGARDTRHCVEYLSHHHLRRCGSVKDSQDFVTYRRLLANINRVLFDDVIKLCIIFDR